MEFTLSLMKNDEREAVSRLVDNGMLAAYGCRAYPLPQRVIVAKQSGRLVGAIAIERPSAGRLPVHDHYDISGRFGPRDGIRAVQIGRWVGCVKGAALALMYEAVRFAKSSGYEWAISETKPCVVRWFRRNGILLERVSGSLRWDSLPEPVIRYYDEPKPVIVALHIRNAMAILGDHVRCCDSRYRFDG